MAEVEENVLDIAKRLTSRDRNEKYGHPYDHHSRTAALVTALIADKLQPGKRITARDWERFMVAEKLSRDVNKESLQNEEDICGYGRTMQMAREEAERRSVCEDFPGRLP